jgi:hypothetical protein
MASRLLFLILCLVAAPGHRAHATIITGLDLVMYCETLERTAKPTGPNTFRWPPDREADTCWGYVGAVQALSAIGDPETGISILGTCLPRDTTAMQVVQAITAYGRSRPEELRIRAAVLALRTLKTAFPCH